MTSVVSDVTATRVRESSARTLAGEHFGLLRNVRRRADAVTALLDVRVWPHAELGTLIEFLRSTVLRHASDEEVLIYPNDCHGGPFADLSAGHARLYALTAQLERVHTERCPLGELRDLVAELIDTLRRHLLTEHDIFETLASVDPAPTTQDTVSRNEDEEEPVTIRLDDLPDELAVQMCIERVLRLAPGHRAEVRTSSRAHLRAITDWLRDFDAARYGLARRAGADGETLLEITCRTREAW